MKLQWIKFIVVLVLYLLFLFWLKSWLGLIVIPFIYDAYISKKINWQWWKDAESPVRFIMSWVDALVFALVAVFVIVGLVCLFCHDRVTSRVVEYHNIIQFNLTESWSSAIIPLRPLNV